jgi:hypothetical protein
MDEFGSLDAPSEPFPVRDVTNHDWLSVPYPALASVVSFEWEPGEAGEKPDVFWYPQMWDWVLSQKAYDVLTGAAPLDLHLIAEGRLDGDPVFLVQVVGVLDDVVDREDSIIERFPSYERLGFPSFFRRAAPTMASRIFKVPDDPLVIFMGETVKQALDTAGIKGFLYVPVDWSE